MKNMETPPTLEQRAAALQKAMKETGRELEKRKKELQRLGKQKQEKTKTTSPQKNWKVARRLVKEDHRAKEEAAERTAQASAKREREQAQRKQVANQTQPLANRLNEQVTGERYLANLVKTYESTARNLKASLDTSMLSPGSAGETAMLAPLRSLAAEIERTAAEHGLAVPASVTGTIERQSKEPVEHLRNAPARTAPALESRTQRETSLPSTETASEETRTTSQPFKGLSKLYAGFKERKGKGEEPDEARAAAQTEKKIAREAATEDRIRENHERVEAEPARNPDKRFAGWPQAEAVTAPEARPARVHAEQPKPASVFAAAIANREGMSMEQKEVAKGPKTGRQKLEEKLAETVPEFNALTDGQKLLVIQGMENAMHAHVRDEARNDYAKEMQTSNWFNRALKGMAKNMLTAKKETAVLKQLHEDTEGRLTNLVSGKGGELVSQLGKSGMEAYVGPDGKRIVTDFAGRDLEGARPLFRTIASEYNEAAKLMPYEWGLPDATSTQKAAFKKAELERKTAADRFLMELREEGRRRGEPSPESFAAEYLIQTELRVKTMGFLASHPDAARRLDAIETQSAVARGVKDTIAERGAYAIGGYAARKALSGITIFAAPVTAAITGYLRGRDRAHTRLREGAHANRTGERQKGALSFGTGSAERHIARLSDYKERLLNSESPIERQRLLSELKTRVDYMYSKLELGQVNFGKEDGRFSRQVELVQMLTEAQAAIGAELNEKELLSTWESNGRVRTQRDAEGNRSYIDATHDVRGLLERMGGANQERVSKEQRAMVRKEALKSAALGAAFAEAGVLVRHFQVFGFHWPGHASAHADAVPASGGAQRPPIGTETPLAATSPTPDHLKVPVATLAKRDSVPAAHTNPLFEKRIDTQTIPTKHIDSAKVIEKYHSGLAAHTAAHEALAKAPVRETIKVPESVAHLQVSSRGLGATIQEFRRTAEFKSLSPAQQKFFQGNLYTIAEKLHGYDPVTGRSLSVGAGSEFGITKQGEIYVTDTLHEGKILDLGKLQANGTFEPGPKGSFLTEHASAHGKHLEGAGNHPTREAANAAREESASGRAETPDTLRATREQIYRHQFTQAEEEELGRATAESREQYLTKLFGTDARRWHVVENMPMKDFIHRATDPNMRPEYRAIYDRVQAFVKESGEQPGDRTVSQELNLMSEWESRRGLLEFKLRNGEAIDAIAPQPLDTPGAGPEIPQGSEASPVASKGFEYPQGLSEHITHKLAGRAERHFRHEIDSYFGDRNFFGAVRGSGEESQPWRVMSGLNTQGLLSADLSKEFPFAYDDVLKDIPSPDMAKEIVTVVAEQKEFLNEVREMAIKYPRVEKVDRFGEYVHALYKEASLEKYLERKGETMVKVTKQ